MLYAPRAGERADRSREAGRNRKPSRPRRGTRWSARGGYRARPRLSQPPASGGGKRRRPIVRTRRGPRLERRRPLLRALGVSRHRHPRGLAARRRLPQLLRTPAAPHLSALLRVSISPSAADAHGRPGATARSRRRGHLLPLLVSHQRGHRVPAIDARSLYVRPRDLLEPGGRGAVLSPLAAFGVGPAAEGLPEGGLRAVRRGRWVSASLCSASDTASPPPTC